MLEFYVQNVFYLLCLLRDSDGFVEFYGEKFGGRIGADGHPVEHTGPGHGLAVVSDDDQL